MVADLTDAGWNKVHAEEVRLLALRADPACARIGDWTVAEGMSGSEHDLIISDVESSLFHRIDEAALSREPDGRIILWLMGEYDEDLEEAAALLANEVYQEQVNDWAMDEQWIVERL
jgi:hypothetical protein